MNEPLNSDTERMKEFSKKQLDKWKSRLEHLNVQMHLGAADAADEFEKQKKKLADWSKETSEKIDTLEGVSKEKLSKLRTDLEELRVQAALGRAEAKNEMKEQQRKISHKLHEIKQELSSTVDGAKESVGEFAEEVEEEAEDWHMKFDLFKVHMSLGKAEAEQYWEDKKKELSYKMQEMQDKLERMKEDADHRWEDFSKEMSDAWSHVKKAFK